MGHQLECAPTLIEPTDIPPADQTQAIIPLSEDRGIVRAAAILAIGNVASRFIGLGREIVKSTLFGTSDLLGAYTVAVLVPMTLFNLISGGEMVSSSLVPVFSDYAAKPKRHELWRLASTFLSLANVVLLVVVLLVELFAPQIAWLAGARNFENQALVPVTIHLTRLVAPAILFLSIASILTALLFALKRFTLPAFTAAVFNATIVIVALLNPDEIESLAWGILLGSILQVLLLVPGLRDSRIRPNFNWRHPAMRRILILYSPIVVALVANQIAIWISDNLAITTGDNSVTYMTYATTLYQFPLGLVVTALSIATLPTLSRLATAYRTAQDNNAPDAERRLNDYKKTLAGGVRLVITLILPAAAGLFALAGPIISLLLEHGQFTAADTETTTQVLRIYILGLAFAAVDQMLIFASYARKDTWRPAAAGVISIVIYTITAIVLIPSLGLLSLMAADAIKHIVHTAIMVWVLQRRLGGFAGYHITSSTIKSLLAAALTGLAAYYSAQFLGSQLATDTLLSRFVIVAGAGLSGVLVYIGAVLVLDIWDAKSLWHTIWNKAR